MVLNRIIIHSKHILFAAAVSGLLLMVGCVAAPVKSQGMVPSQFELSEKHPATVALRIEGGRNEHAMQLPVISNEVFLEAIQEAIRQSTVFKAIDAIDAGEYRIDATLFNLSQPFFGRAPVHLEIAWRLVRMSSEEVIWKESITTSDSGFPTPNQSEDQVYNKTRAIENAAKKNIQKALEQMSQVNL